MTPGWPLPGSKSIFHPKGLLLPRSPAQVPTPPSRTWGPLGPCTFMQGQPTSHFDLDLLAQPPYISFVGLLHCPLRAFRCPSCGSGSVKMLPPPNARVPQAGGLGRTLSRPPAAPGAAAGGQGEPLHAAASGTALRTMTVILRQAGLLCGCQFPPRSESRGAQLRW